MPIPDSFIEDLRTQVNIGKFIQSQGVNLKRAGTSSKANCPFPDHDDKSPSFNVIHEKNFCYCHGCGGGGDVIKFAMKFSGLSFPDAVEKVAHFAGMEVPNSDTADKNDVSKAIYATLKHAQGIYQNNLAKNENPNMSQLLLQRKLTTDSVNRFGLGVAKDDWNQVKINLGGNDRKNLLIQSGLAVYQAAQDGQREKFYDRFRDGIIFPIRDTNGQVATFAIRHADGRSPKYINGPETNVFKKSRILYGMYEALENNKRPESINVVEGYFDVIKCAQHGFNNAVAPMGTAITDTHIQKLIRSTNNITFCFDGDNAGRKAAKRTLHTLLSYVDDSHTYKFCLLPEGYDPDSLLDEKGAPALQQYLDDAQPLSAFIFSTALEGKDISIREDAAKLASEFSGLLNQMPESHLKADLAKRFELHTGIPLKQSLNIKVSTKEMNPSEIMGLSNDVRKVVAQRGGVNPDSVQVHISADHYQPETALNRFVNQQSIISQSLPVTATLTDKVNLLNKAMEQVVINSNLSIKDESGIPIVQILTDAFKNPDECSPSELRLKQICIGQLRNILVNNDMSNLIHIITTEVSRINRLGTHLCSKHPDKKSTVIDSLQRFCGCVRDNTKYLDALGRFSPSEAYGEAYLQAMNKLKKEVQDLSANIPSTEVKTNAKGFHP